MSGRDMSCGKKLLYRLLQCTWGLPQTLLGAVYFLLNIKGPHSAFRGAISTTWKSKSSLSLGMFIFVSDDPFFYYADQRSRYDENAFSRMLLVHEYGHTIQSLIFGPLYLLAVGLPSVAWSFFPFFVRKRAREEISYFSAYPERWANRLGEAAAKEKSIGEPV